MNRQNKNLVPRLFFLTHMRVGLHEVCLISYSMIMTMIGSHIPLTPEEEKMLELIHLGMACLWTRGVVVGG